MRTRLARISQIEKAKKSLDEYDRECRRGRAIHALVLQNAFGDFINEYPGSLRELAARLRFSAAFLSDVRNGRRNVTVDLLKRLAELK